MRSRSPSMEAKSSGAASRKKKTPTSIKRRPPRSFRWAWAQSMARLPERTRSDKRAGNARAKRATVDRGRQADALAPLRRHARRDHDRALGGGLRASSRRKNSAVREGAGVRASRVVSYHYATVRRQRGDAIGLLVESHEGRPTKIEGNPQQLVQPRLDGRDHASGDLRSLRPGPFTRPEENAGNGALYLPRARRRIRRHHSRKLGGSRRTSSRSSRAQQLAHVHASARDREKPLPARRNSTRTRP